MPFELFYKLIQLLPLLAFVYFMYSALRYGRQAIQAIHLPAECSEDLLENDQTASRLLQKVDDCLDNSLIALILLIAISLFLL